jgi:DNA-binding response OmpR family regulator
MPKKILLVDDEPNILLSLEFMMSKAGYQVYIARNGNEAFYLLEENSPDLIVLDIMMPDVDGYEICTYIRGSERHAQARVIFLSAKSRKEDIDKGYQLGADLYMTKPFSTKKLMKAIEQLA